MGNASDYSDKGLALFWEKETPARFINYAYDKKALIALEEYFGDFPITIRREDVKVLRAMQTAGGGRPLDDLIHVVESDGPIRIWWDKQSRAGEVAYRFAATTD